MGIENGRIDDLDKAREMAEASNTSHNAVEDAKKRLENNPGEIGYFDERDIPYWESEARIDERTAGALYDARKEIEGLGQEDLRKLLRIAEENEKEVEKLGRGPQSIPVESTPYIEAVVKVAVIKEALKPHDSGASKWFRN